MPDHRNEILQPIVVAALYQFADFANCRILRDPLAKLCAEQGIRGTVLLASEGINGTIAGTADGIAQVLEHLRAFPGCADLDVKLSSAGEMPFNRMKVRLKREIVTMGQPCVLPGRNAGIYVDAQDWNALISGPDTIVIDTRNDYEVAVGTFAGAINPQTSSFRDFPDWFRRERERLLGNRPGAKVAMFCTGGIRCEKSTAFLSEEGVGEVYHLRGGILKYLETVPEAYSLWRGECFVFDRRVTVGHGLAESSYSLCHACRRPVSAADRESPNYEAGASCPACHSERDEQQREGYRERHRQEMLAGAQGRAHVGAVQSRGAQPREG